MKIKNILIFTSIIFSFFMSACNNSEKKLTQPEYTKTVIVQKTNFDSIIENFLDQVDTYDKTEDSTNRLNKLAESAEEFVTTLKRTVGPVVPDDAQSHYDQMVKYYNMYIEGIQIYKDNLPKELSDTRNEAIHLAEKKFHDAQSGMMNIK